MSEVLEGGHSHDVHLACDGYGVAYHYVYECVDGTLWIGNGEYASPVNFCPICGIQAQTPAPEETE